jgi:hypothetical protein
VLSLLLYSLFIHDYVAKHDSNTIIKFADDTTVVTDNDETVYREEVRNLAVWCQDNNLSLNINKTKEMTHRKRRAEQAPISIDRAVVEKVVSFKFLDVHIKTVVKRVRQNLLPLRRLKRFGMGPQNLKVLQLHHREHPDQLHHHLVWQLLGIRG